MAIEHQKINFFLLLILASACAAPHSWSADTIATGDKTFDSSRLKYLSAQAHPVILFEMLKIGDQVEAFISLTRFRFTSRTSIKILFTIEGESFEDFAAVNEGGMRVKLESKTTQQLIQALQEGHKIAILIDGFEETLDPAQFSSFFAKFIGEGHFFQNLFKGRK